jgi:hypothetical protein
MADDEDRRAHVQPAEAGEKDRVEDETDRVKASDERQLAQQPEQQAATAAGILLLPSQPDRTEVGTGIEMKDDDGPSRRRCRGRSVPVLSVADAPV